MQVVVIRSKWEDRDIIGFLEKVRDTHIILRNPYYAVLNGDRLDVFEFCPMADSEEFQFYMEDVLFCSPVIEEVERAFITTLSSLTVSSEHFSTEIH